MGTEGGVRQVILIDDNRADNLYHRLILADSMPRTPVAELSGGREALAYMAEAEDRGLGPDLLLLDLNMPAMTGWEFIDTFDPETVPGARGVILIILSTTENPDDIARARQHPRVDGFLSKPLNCGKLSKLLTDHRLIQQMPN